MCSAWPVTYKPKSLKQIIGNAETIQKFVEWVDSWEKGVPKKRASFLYGPPGIGKTVTVEALANDYKIELVERKSVV